MSILPADSGLYAALFHDSEVAAEFSEARFIQYMLEVEAALALAQSKLGVIPPEAGAAIAAGTTVLELDMQQLMVSTEKSSLPVPELVRQLRAQVGGEAASYVHWGATSQDIMDTALVLQIRPALAVIENNLAGVITNLAELADRHRDTIMAGRTHSQQALPIPFGLKVAGWLAPLVRHRQRLAEIKPRLLCVQFGGAAGTLSVLGESGLQVQAALAGELNLTVPPMPWHTQRDNLVELAGWLSLVSGSLAKMAQDIILLAQTEIGELRESADSTRGGSSTMPQKHNPVISELIIAIARHNATLLSSMQQALIQEHERATHGWQLEWLTLPQMVTLTAAAVKKALFLAQNLQVDTDRMRHNVEASNGLMFAEAISFALTGSMSRSEAIALVKQACLVAVEQDRHLLDVVKEKTQAPVDWQTLKDTSAYSGSSHAFIDNVLLEARKK